MKRKAQKTANTNPLKSKKMIKPLEDRIVVKPIDKTKENAAGLLIPDSDNAEKPTMGTVMAVGPGRSHKGVRIPVDVAVGDTVLFNKFAPVEIKDGDDNFVIISEIDILAKFSND